MSRTDLERNPELSSFWASTQSARAVQLDWPAIFLIGSSTMLFCDGRKTGQARDGGERIFELVRENKRFSHFMNEASLRNGIKHVSANGGSTLPDVCFSIVKGNRPS